jgi:hypothetical protein
MSRLGPLGWQWPRNEGNALLGWSPSGRELRNYQLSEFSATQAEAEAGTNTTKFITPKTSEDHFKAAVLRYGVSNVLSYGASRDPGADNTAAFMAMIADVGCLRIPSGSYRVTGTIVGNSVTIEGDGQPSYVYGDSTNPALPVFRLGSHSRISHIMTGFAPGRITGAEAAGERVAVWLGTSPATPFCRGASISNIRVDDCGTAFHDQSSTGPTFSAGFTNIEVRRARYAGFNFLSNLRTQNSFNNIYINNENPNNPNSGLTCAYGMNFEGQDDSEMTLDGINVELLESYNAIKFTNCRAVQMGVVHVEKWAARDNAMSTIYMNSSSVSIGALTVYYSMFRANCDVFSLVDSVYTAPGDPDVEYTNNSLSIGILHLKGLCGYDAGGSYFVPVTTPANVRLFNRYSNDGPFYVRVDQLTWYTFLTDRSWYLDPPRDSNGWITFLKLGNLPLSGAAASRPTQRLVPYQTTFFDTANNRLEMWNGTGWMQIGIMDTSGRLLVGQKNSSSHPQLIDRNGFSSNPAFSFWSDDNTGLAHTAASEAALVSSGTPRIRATSRGAALPNLPTSTTGLSSGDLWRDTAAGNVIKMVP